jgi:hypothetical protein
MTDWRELVAGVFRVVCRSGGEVKVYTEYRRWVFDTRSWMALVVSRKNGYQHVFCYVVAVTRRLIIQDT